MVEKVNIVEVNCVKEDTSFQFEIKVHNSFMNEETGRELLRGVLNDILKHIENKEKEGVQA